jgi:hypothetical protein
VLPVRNVKCGLLHNLGAELNAAMVAISDSYGMRVPLLRTFSGEILSLLLGINRGTDTGLYPAEPWRGSGGLR